MSQLQESFWKQKKKLWNDGATYFKAQFNRKRKRNETKRNETKRNEKIHAARFEAVKQERHDNKTGKTCYSSEVALLEDQDQEATTKNANAQCKHCVRNDHHRKSSTDQSVHSFKAKRIVVPVLVLHVNPVWPA